MSDGRTVCCRSRENGELYRNRTVFGWCYSVGANTKIDRDDKNGTAVIFVLLHVWELSLRSADDGFHFALFYTYSSPSDVKVTVKHAQPLTSMQIIVLHFFRRRFFFRSVPLAYKLALSTHTFTYCTVQWRCSSWEN